MGKISEGEEERRRFNTTGSGHKMGRNRFIFPDFSQKV